MADGAPYYCKDVSYKGTSVSKWVCSHKTKHGADSCPSMAIYEDELNPIVLETFQTFMESADGILNRYMEQYRRAVEDTVSGEAEREHLKIGRAHV